MRVCLTGALKLLSVTTGTKRDNLSPQGEGLSCLGHRKKNRTRSPWGLTTVGTCRTLEQKKENTMNKNCNNCDKNLALSNAYPHCRNSDCTWMVCPCGHTTERRGTGSMRTDNP